MTKFSLKKLKNSCLVKKNVISLHQATEEMAFLLNLDDENFVTLPKKIFTSMKHYLNKREEIVMKILWNLKKAFLKEIIEDYPKPKPPSTTIASIVKKLETRGFVKHRTIGKTHQYMPLLEQDDYKKSELKSLVQNYFSGSFEELVSFFYKGEKKVDVEELQDIFQKIKKQQDEN